jgi:PAS domain S-box-containing protein
MTDAGVRTMGEAAAGSPADRLGAAFQQWNSILEALPIGVYVTGLDGEVIHFNHHAETLWGRTPGDDRFSGQLKIFWPDGRSLERSESPVGQVLKSGAAARDVEVVIERPDGSRIDVLASLEPLRDGDGALLGVVTCFQDVTEVKRTRSRADRLDSWVRRVVELSPVAMYVTDADGRVLSFNPAAANLWGRAPVVGEDQWCGSHRLYHPDGRPMPLDTCPMATALKSGEAIHGLEAVYERPDGHRGAFLAYPTLLHDAAGGLMGAVNMLVDISDRKQAEERQKVLVDELNHRVKNTLASVQSLAAHSLRGGVEPDRMRERFEARLVALSNAHNQLADRRWQDADLRALAEEVLAPYRADHRITLDGDAVMVSAKLAVSLSMVLHELATNAVKYGALSVTPGRLSVSWRRGGADRLVLEWRETDGPSVPPPIRRGFGTRFIAGAIGGELGGQVEHEFAPDGVRCRIETPL